MDLHHQMMTPRTHFEQSLKTRSRLTLDIVMNLDAATIETIRAAFMGAPDQSVDLNQFTQIIRDNIPRDSVKVDENQFVQSIVELFRAMDLDGDQSLNFEEFLATIIHTGTEGGEQYVINPVKSYHVGPTHTLSSRGIDRILKYVTEIDKLVVLESKRRQFKILEPSSMEIKREISSRRGDLIAAEYIPQESIGQNTDLLAMSTTQAVSFWSGISTNKFEHKKDILVRDPQTAIKWGGEQKALFTGSIQGDVHAWNVDSMTKSYSLAVGGRRPHKLMVTAIEAMQGMNEIVTAGLDKRILMWDISHGDQKREWGEAQGGHKKGVVCLHYSQDFRFLLSGGFDHIICLWSPFAERVVCSLEGHASPLIGAHFVPGTPQIVSMDMDGFIKVWDARNFQCVQTIAATDPEAHSIASCGAVHRRLCVATPKKLLCFDEEGGPYRKEADEEPISCVLYNETYLSFCSAAGRDIKIWNALNGRLQRIYRDIAQSDITAICFDDRQRKLIVGEHEGSIKVFNYGTGAHMKSFEEHKGEVTFLAFVAEERHVVSAGWDGVIKIHDERPIEQNDVIFRLSLDALEITSVSLSYAVSVYACGDVAGNVHLWDMEVGKVEGICRVESRRSSIIALTFLGDYPLLCACDDTGFATIYYTRPSAHKFKPAMVFKNLNAMKQQIPISAVVFDTKTCQLLTGDHDGSVKAWNFEHFISDTGVISIAIDQGRFGRRLGQIEEYVKRMENIPYKLWEHANNISPTWWVRAHNDAVKSLQFTTHPTALISSSYDQHVKIWSMDGEQLGIITSDASGSKSISAASSDPYWGFCVDVQRREETDRKNAENILRELEKCNVETEKLDRAQVLSQPYDLIGSACQHTSGFSASVLAEYGSGSRPHTTPFVQVASRKRELNLSAVSNRPADTTRISTKHQSGLNTLPNLGRRTSSCGLGLGSLSSSHLGVLPSGNQELLYCPGGMNNDPEADHSSAEPSAPVQQEEPDRHMSPKSSYLRAVLRDASTKAIQISRQNYLESRAGRINTTTMSYSKPVKHSKPESPLPQSQNETELSKSTSTPNLHNPQDFLKSRNLTRQMDKRREEIMAEKLGKKPIRLKTCKSVATLSTQEHDKRQLMRRKNRFQVEYDQEMGNLLSGKSLESAKRLSRALNSVKQSSE